VAGRIGLVAYPKRDRWHRTPTPLLGGVAIFAGSIPVVVLIAEAISAHMLDRFAALLLGAILIFALGGEVFRRHRLVVRRLPRDAEVATS
jgi:UDP-GlcNAc:undecaprenyl-phosphate GlcNAc-1-phosphate transferase